MWNHLSIFQKLSIGFIILVMVPVFVFSLTYYFLMRDKMIEQHRLLLTILSRNVVEDIDRYLAEDQSIVRYLAGSKEVEQYCATAATEEQAGEKLARWLATQAALAPSIRALYFLSPDGVCTSSTESAFLGQNYGVRRYFRESMEGRTFKSDWSIGLTTSEPGMFISAPVRHKEKITGVLVLKVRTAPIENAISRWADGGMNVFLLNRHGIILCHTRKSLIYSAIAPLSQPALQEINSDLQFANRVIPDLNLPSLSAALHAVLSKDSFYADSVRYDLMQQPMIAVLTRLKEQDWAVGLAMPERTIASAATPIMYNTLILASLMVLTVCLIGLLIARTIIRPLLELTEDVNRFAAGDTSVRTAISCTDEIGILGASFNHMAQTITNHTQELERTVRERTTELERAKHELEQELQLQRLTAASLRKNKERFRLISESVNALIWVIDAKTERTSYIGPYIEKLRGFTVAEAMAQPLTESLTPESYEKVTAAMREYLARYKATREPLNLPPFEITQPCKDGRIISTEVKVSVVTDSEGEIREFIGISWDISDRQAEAAKLAYLSHHDGLTGLYNRAYFNLRLESPRNFPLGILSADLDGLKRANDSLGHEAGDRLITGAAEIFRMALREGDVIARTGGDEFAILISDSDEIQLATIVARIRACEEAYNNDRQCPAVRISLGAAVARCLEEVKDALNTADARMYANKRERAGHSPTTRDES